MTARKSPDIFDVILHKGEDWTSLPEPVNPYYVLAQEGKFQYRKTALGNILLSTNDKFEKIGKLGTYNGFFDWKGPKFPAHLISQAHDYFKRIYIKHGTEAELIITRKITDDYSGEFRLFVPFQRANGAGVKSIYEPTHIDHDYLVVGTLHSHCMMGAFHSGTDTGDGSDMDGVHFTIGKVNMEEPEIVAMVMMGKKEFHFKPPTGIADIEYGTTTAPLWWDDYLLIDPPKTIPSTFKTLTQEHWNQFLGLHVGRTTYQPQQYGGQNHQSQWSAQSGWKPQPAKPTQPWSAHAWSGHRGSEDQPQQMSKRERRRLAKLNKQQPDQFTGRDGSVWVRTEAGYYKPETEVKGFKIRKVDDTDGRAIDLAIDAGYEAGIFKNDDMDEMSAAEMDDIFFWQQFFGSKLVALKEIMEVLGLKVDISLSRMKFTPQLEGQMTMEEAILPEEPRQIPAHTGAVK